jgi:hypothetical protein
VGLASNAIAKPKGHPEASRAGAPYSPARCLEPSRDALTFLSV